MEIPEYLRKSEKKLRKSLEVTARFRLGCEAKANYFWLSHAEKLCRLCKEKEETTRHIFEECNTTGKAGKSWIEQLTAMNAFARMWEILWKRKRKEEAKEIV